MRIGVISDIHIDRNKAYPVTEVLAEKTKEKKLDCLLLAGDVSNRYKTTFAFFERFAGLTDVPFYFVPGNHDLWDEAGEYGDTREIYRRYAEHPRCLSGRCVPLGGGWAAVGETGWYDHSFGNPKFSPEEFARHSMYGRTWMDSVNTRWHADDRQVHREMLARLERSLAEGTAAGSKLIAVPHVVGIRAFLVPETRGKWDYFNAFLGSPDYGELYRRCNVRYGVMGHVHFRRTHAQNGIRFVCACLNYFTEWRTGDVGKEIDDALSVLTL